MSLNTISKLSVSFSKMVADGNFGNERAECTLEYDELSDEAEAVTVADRLAGECRRLVHAQLERSPSANVRNGVVPARETKKLTVPRTADEEPF